MADHGQSIQILLKQRGYSVGWFAEAMDLKYPNASRLANQKSIGERNMQKVLKVFDLKESEFVAIAGY